MRIKIGNTWHEVTRDAPIMVEFTDTDLDNVGALVTNGGNKYAAFHDDCGMDPGEMFAWMESPFEDGSDIAAFKSEGDDPPKPEPQRADENGFVKIDLKELEAWVSRRCEFHDGRFKAIE